jgi:hypothetical protein
VPVLYSIFGRTFLLGLLLRKFHIYLLKLKTEIRQWCAEIFLGPHSGLRPPFSRSKKPGEGLYSMSVWCSRNFVTHFWRFVAFRHFGAYHFACLTHPHAKFGRIRIAGGSSNAPEGQTPPRLQPRLRSTEQSPPQLQSTEQRGRRPLPPNVVKGILEIRRDPGF